MITTRRTGIGAAATALLPPVAACSGRSRDEVQHIAIVSKGFQQQFWQAVKQGADAEAEAQGVVLTFEGPPTESDIEAQITMLQNTVTREPDGLAIAALDSRAAADRKSTRLNSSHVAISYAVFCLKKKSSLTIQY